MKRDRNLVALSRDHHHGLLLGWKIRQGLKNNVSPILIAEYILYFYQAALLPHFGEEEQQILTLLDDDNEMKLKTIDDHRKISRLINSLNSGRADSVSFLEIASTLDEHIRFEERQLFPYLQEKLSSEKLDEMGQAIERIHHPFVDTFHTEFWTVSKN